MMRRWREGSTMLGMVFLVYGCAPHKDPVENTAQRSLSPTAEGTGATTKPPPGKAHNVKNETHEESHHHEHFVANGTLVTDHGVPLIAETQAFQWSPEERARRVTARLNMVATSHELDADSVTMRRINGFPTVFYYHHHGPGSEGHILATIDPLTANQFGHKDDSEALAYWWRDVLKDHLLIIEGKPPLWTTQYTPTLQRFYEQLQRIRAGVPSHSSFDLALTQISPQNREDLAQLYRNVPANYHPRPDNLQAAEHTHSHHEEGEEHVHTHDHTD